MTLRSYTAPNGLELRYLGPPLAEGPLPTLLYFALSAEDSLQRPPFQQPVQQLENLPLRIFSATLPGHENGLPPENALHIWTERMERGDFVILPFVQQVREALISLTSQIKPKKLGVMGLSRGAFIACHLAAICPEISTLLGFAPLTRFAPARHLDVETLTAKLCARTIRFYIGNRDSRVGTDHTYSFVQKLAAEAYERGIRSSPIELIIGPSIGYKGHGTAPEIFASGAHWMRRNLLP